MACTIDHLQADHRVRVLRDFTDARGLTVRAGESATLRRMDFDPLRREISMEWERNGATEKLIFDLSAKDGPGNGRMRAFFELGERVEQLSNLQGMGPTQAVANAGAQPAAKPPTERRPASKIGVNHFAGKQPPADTCLEEVAVACDCDPALHRPVLLASAGVNACLRCRTVTCTKSVGDDGRFTGDAWHAYLTVDVPQSVVAWLALWPRVRVDYGAAPDRWPMAGELVRYPRLFYPATMRCSDAAELLRLEAQLAGEQAGYSHALLLRAMECPPSPPPPGVPASLHGFVEVWEALQLQPESDLKTLIRFAQLRSPASAIAADLLLRRADAFDVMVTALRSNDEIWRSAGIAMARDASPADPRLAGVLIEIMQGLSLAPLPDVPGRIVSCLRFEALLVVIADLKLATPEMFAALKALQRRLARHDAELVKDIGIVLRELRGEPPPPRRTGSLLP